MVISCEGLFRWILRLDFQQSILLWKQQRGEQKFIKQLLERPRHCESVLVIKTSSLIPLEKVEIFCCCCFKVHPLFQKQENL